MREKIKRWWQGEHISASSPGSALVFLNIYRRHWTSRVAHALVDFYLRHWQFVWTFASGVVALIFAYLALK